MGVCLVSTFQYTLLIHTGHYAITVSPEFRERWSFESKSCLFVAVLHFSQFYNWNVDYIVITQPLYFLSH